MRSVYIVIVISLSVLAFAEGLSVKKCNPTCTKIYKPICAALKRGSTTTMCTFANKCILDYVMCSQLQTWKVIDADKKCKQDSCDCRDIIKSG